MATKVIKAQAEVLKSPLEAEGKANKLSAKGIFWSSGLRRSKDKAEVVLLE